MIDVVPTLDRGAYRLTPRGHVGWLDTPNRRVVIRPKLPWPNLLMLLGVATLPFPTALLAEFVGDGGRPAATAALIYGLLSVATALPWVLMWRHIRDHPELLAHGLGDDHARAELRRASMGPIIYIFAIPLALVVPLLALVFYLAISVIYAISSQGARVGAEASE